MPRIKKVMVAKAISTKELAKRLDTDTKQVRRYLAQGEDIKFSTLRRIAQALKVKISDLFDEDP